MEALTLASMINQRLLGAHTGLRVSALALGTGRIGTAPDRATDPGEARATLDAFADAGGTFLDTSSAYQRGRAEEMLGEFLTDRGRDAFVVASKYGRTPQVNPPSASVGNHRGAMIAEVEGSLRRLRTDRIDLYFPHFDDGVTPIEEIMSGLEDLRRAGKIVHAGFSNFPAWRTAAAAILAEERGWLGVVALQLQYNLLERSIEREHLPMAEARGMAVIAWSPLAGGRLTRAGKPDAEATERESAIKAALDAVAIEVRAAPAAVAIAWVRAKGVIPVLGPRTREQLLENLLGADLCLSEAQVRKLDEASAMVLGYPYDLLAKQGGVRGESAARTEAVS